MKKIFVITLTIFFILIYAVNVNAAGFELDLESMKNVSKLDTSGGTNTGVNAILNDIIGYLQLGGTAIAVITVTLLGAKYMVSSVEEKATIKNKAMPIVIGCILLFAGVNLVALVANFTNGVLGNPE